MYRTIATQFSGATGVPISSLGIVTDNPPSAEALYADDRRIVNTARKQNREVFIPILRQVGRMAVMLRDNLTAVTPELESLDAQMANPAFTSPASSADALVKLSAVFPWLSESEVALEFAGFSHAEITRLLSDKRRAQGSAGLMEQLAALGAAGDIQG
jgi:hypothetical protein